MQMKMSPILKLLCFVRPAKAEENDSIKGRDIHGSVKKHSGDHAYGRVPRKKG